MPRNPNFELMLLYQNVYHETHTAISKINKWLNKYTSPKVLWSEVSRFVDNSFNVQKRIIHILWEVNKSADWSCWAKIENKSDLYPNLNQ